MVDGLLGASASPASTTKADADRALAVLRPFISAAQAGALAAAMQGEEAQSFLRR